MKWLCLVLLAINLAYFGWTLDQRTGEHLRQRASALPIPARAADLKLLHELDTALPRKTSAASPDLLAAALRTEAERSDNPLGIEATLPDISTTLPDSLLVPLGLSVDSCFSFGPFTDRTTASRFLDWLGKRDTRAALRLESNTQSNLFWVYLEADAGGAAALVDLRARGVSDVSLIQEGELKDAVSLGLFSTQAAVNRRLRELQAQGYQPIAIPYADTASLYWVDARITRSTDIDAIGKTFPAGLNYLPVRCDKIADSLASQ
ncbi:MAG: hypothetical protein WD572_10300 [Gammaproteobacteria bacterium]